jgi:hypothetical protein
VRIRLFENMRYTILIIFWLSRFSHTACSICLKVLACTSVSIFGTNTEEGCASIYRSCNGIKGGDVGQGNSNGTGTWPDTWVSNGSKGGSEQCDDLHWGEIQN